MRRDWTPVVLGVGLFVVYTANGRPIGAGDVVPATLLPVALLRGDGPVLDRFAGVLRTAEGGLPGYVEEARGHLVSRYPIGPALVGAPLVWPQLVLLDAAEPGWERDRERVRPRCARMAKNAAAAIVALSAIVMLSVLRGLGFGRVAPAAVLIVGLGSDDAAVAAQAPWQHGPAELGLAVALWLLAGRRGETSSPLRCGLAGLAAAGMVVCRPVDVVYAGAVAVAVMASRGRAERWAFTLSAAAVAVALAAYQVWFFDTLAGGYAAIERMHPWAHGTRGTWTAPFLEGALGTLVSPSHGLFVYCPWVAAALGLLPWTWRLLPRGPVGAAPKALLIALLPSFVLLSKYSCWWGGHCYGPRFWIDANPIFAVALAGALEWARRRGRGAMIGFAALAAWSAALQLVAMVCYPSSWHGRPVNADRHHERLWDWRDSEPMRCLREGPRPRAG